MYDYHQWRDQRTLQWKFTGISWDCYTKKLTKSNDSAALMDSTCLKICHFWGICNKRDHTHTHKIMCTCNAWLASLGGACHLVLATWCWPSARQQLHRWQRGFQWGWGIHKLCCLCLCTCTLCTRQTLLRCYTWHLKKQDCNYASL